MSTHIYLNPAFEHLIADSSDPSPRTPIQEAKNLIFAYTSNLLSPQGCRAVANSILRDLTTLAQTNLYIAMEGFCWLLKLEIDDFQQSLLKTIHSNFHPNFTTKDLNDANYLKIFDLEIILHEIIERHIRFDRSLDTLASLMQLYQDILEHLWLMPYVQGNLELIPLKERSGPLIESHIREWASLMGQNRDRYVIFRAAWTEALFLAKMITSTFSEDSVIERVQKNRMYFYPPFNSSYYFLGVLGSLYNILGLHTRSINYSKESLDRLEIQSQTQFLNNKKNITVLFKILTHNRLGMPFARLNDFDTALEYCNKSWNVTNDLEGKEKLRMHADISQGIGRIFCLKKDYTQAIVHFQKQLEITEKLKDLNAQKMVYRDLEEAYTLSEQFEKAVGCKEKFLQLDSQEKTESREPIPVTLRRIQCFLDKDHTESKGSIQPIASQEECLAIANTLVLDLSVLDEDNAGLAQDGLCLLLKLDDGDLRQKILQKLQPLIYAEFSHIQTLDEIRYQKLLNLESSVSVTIHSCTLSHRSHPTFILLLELHQSLLELLWLLPYLKDDKASYIALKNQHAPLIKIDAEKWIVLIEQEKENSEDLKNAITATRQLLSKMILPLPQNVWEYFVTFHTVERFEQPFAFFDVISQLHIIARHYLKARDYCLKALARIKILKKFHQSVPEDFFKTTLTKRPQPYLEAYFLSRLQNIYLLLEKNELAVTYYKKSQKIEAELSIQEKLKLKLHINRDLGNAYCAQERYERAIPCYLKQLDSAVALGDQTEQRRAYRQISNTYCAMGEYQKGIEYLSNELNLTSTPEDQVPIYNQLGLAYTHLRNFGKAREYYKLSLSLAITKEFSDCERTARSRLGIIEYYLGNFEQALAYYEPLLSLSVASQLLEEQFGYFNNTGTLYFAVGDRQRAQACYKKCLRLAKQTGSPNFIETAYFSLIDFYFYSDRVKSFNYLLKLLKKMTKKKRHLEAKVYAYLGKIFVSQKDYPQAIHYYQKSLKKYAKLKDFMGQSTVYSGLARIYRQQGEHALAVKTYEESLGLLRQLNDRIGIANVLESLGQTYLSAQQIEEARACFQKSIREFSLAQNNLGSNHEWHITFFEECSTPYKGLELALVIQNNFQEALQVSESRRSQFLNRTLANNLSLSDEIDGKLSVDEIDGKLSVDEIDGKLSVDEIQQLAKLHRTTFIVYSIQNPDSKIFIWVISAQQIQFVEIPTNSVEDELLNFDHTLENFPFYRTRMTQTPTISSITQLAKSRGGSPVDEKLKFVRKELKRDLARWYETFIDPIKDYLPQDPEETIAFVLDGFLTQLPFNLFLDPDTDSYLIERHPITTIPSLKTLKLMSNKTRTDGSEHIVVMGNPDTGKEDDRLTFADKEAQSLGQLFQLKADQVLRGKEATPTRIKEAMQHARLIFFSCHGLDKKRIIQKAEISDSTVLQAISDDQYSVFEGSLCLAPDEEHPSGHLDSKEISQLCLNDADFVYLGACFSGTGGLWEEGSIGLVRSFIAAGASVVMAAYWKVMDSEITVTMVEEMAKNLIAPEHIKLTPALALQKIMKDMILEYPDNIEEWGVFFLTGI